MPALESPAAIAADHGILRARAVRAGCRCVHDRETTSVSGRPGPRAIGFGLVRGLL